MNAENRRGILMMSGAMAFFIANDALVKLVSASLPTAQLIFVRGLLTTLLLGGVVLASGLAGQWRQLLQPTVALRALFDAGATFTYLTALFHLPIGNATAINLSAPLFLTLFAVFLLGERVDAKRWALIVLGFVGVLLVVQPSAEGFNGYALLCVFATLLHAARDLLTRKVPARVPSLIITLATACTVTVLSGLACVAGEWRPMGPGSLARLVGAALCLAAAYHLLTLSMRAGDMSVIGPFRYSGLLVALLLGYLLWGDVPNVVAWGGILLLVAAGLGMLHGERQRSRAALDAATD